MTVDAARAGLRGASSSSPRPSRHRAPRRLPAPRPPAPRERSRRSPPSFPPTRPSLLLTVVPPLPATAPLFIGRLGRARRERDLEGHPLHRGCRSRRRRQAATCGDRHHEPARDGRRLGRATGEPLHRAIVWQDRRTAAAATSCGSRATSRSSASAPASCSTRTSPARRSSGCSTATSTASRARGRASAVRHDRRVADLQAHRARTSPTTQRVAHAAVRHPRAAWDDELCGLLGVPPPCCPRRSPRRGASARPTRLRRARSRSRDGRRPAGGALRPGCLSPGLAKNTYGTGSFVLLNAGQAPPSAPGPAHDDRLAASATARTTRSRRACSSPARPCSGCATGWASSAAAETEALAASLDANDGVYFVPALSGSAPALGPVRARDDRRAHARHGARAPRARALEAIAYQTVDAVEADGAGAGRGARRAAGRRRRRRERPA